jgi:hypothetical protein
MAYPLPEEIKQHTTALCGNSNLEVLDPGTLKTDDDGRWLVAVKDRLTEQMLWLEVRVTPRL